MASSKECFKCKTVKDLSEFYKHPSMRDGHLSKCKECTRKDVLKHRSENLEKIREYDRQRAKNKARIALNVRVTKAWRDEDRRRTAAHNAVARAIKNGDLTKLPCIRCGEENSLAHHEDYDRKLDVMWLCQPCHKQRHKEINAMLKEKAA